MQSEFDKEIDSLLREGARRGRAAPATPLEWGARGRAGDGGDLLRATPSGAHLDVDERNAYAENSLPQSARTHYAAHLADCDDCRRSVTQLALAAGTPAQLEQRAAATGLEVLPGVTWRERLGALFAPRAWRYAVPALALLLVGAVALMVSMRRTQQSSDVSVAEQRNSAPDKTKIALPESHHAQQNNNAAAAAYDRDTLSTSNSNAPLMREEVATVAGEEQGQAKSGAVLTDDAAPPPPAPVTSGAGAATATAPAAAANIPQPMPTPAPVPEEVIARQDAEQKNKASERAEEFAKDAQKQGNYETNQSREHISGPRRNEQSRNMQRGGNISIARDGANKNDAVLAATPPPPPPAATTAARRAPPREADEARSARASNDAKKGEGVAALKSTAETRTVAGRKFRRSGGAWIDTAYNSSQSVTAVRRNSEQYRALIADEPELRRISDALGGEVTVVWKGRAYRIR